MLDPDDKMKGKTQISYCPHVDVYRYVTVDGQVFLFDTGQLEVSIETFLKDGDAKQADFMALLTSFARQLPHSVITFDEEGKADVTELVARSHVGEVESSGSGKKSVG